jgi:hypothetical protein
MTALMSDEWAQEIQQLLRGWPDEREQSDPRKTETYWKYFDRKRSSFDGTFALGIRDLPGADGPQYVAITYDGAGTCTAVAIEPRDQALAHATLAMECSYQVWQDMAGGYEISKAMTYHQLPLTKGGSVDLLRCVYFIHELIVVTLRPAADVPVAVPA